MDEAGKVDCPEVVSSGEAAEVLELVEASFDAVAMFIGHGVVRDDGLAAAVRRDHRPGAQVGDEHA